MAFKAQQHYGKIYSENLNIEDDNAINKFLQECNMKKLSNEQCQLLNKTIIDTEFDTIIGKTITTKSIGHDNVSNELLRYTGFSKYLL